MNDIDMVGEQEEMAHPTTVDDGVIGRSDSLFSLFKIQVPIAVIGVNEDNTIGLQSQSHIRSSIELSKSHYNDGGRRKRLNRNALSHQQQERHRHQPHQQGMLHFRKKSFSRSRAAILNRFEGRSTTDTDQHPATFQNSRSYLDHEEDYPTAVLERTVFVSEYI